MRPPLVIAAVFTLVLFVMLVSLSGCISQAEVIDFESCIAAGNPAMESHPRQCRDPDTDRTFVEVIEELQPLLTYEEAVTIAKGECLKIGTLGEGHSYNGFTDTWWFDFTPNAVRSGCNPACVVDEVKKVSGINWRCTGLIDQPKNCGDGICENFMCTAIGCVPPEFPEDQINCPEDCPKDCPDEWIVDAMPGIYDKNESREYFILDGERHELSEYDVDWVEENCGLEKQTVY